MYDNTLIETTLTQNYYQEYLTLVNTYQNVKRPAIFTRYLNVNMNASTFNNEADSTYDKYDSKVIYDAYDYTPLYYTSQLINDISDNPDLLGQQVQGFITATSFTIKEPRHEDLIINIYPPLDGGEIFRVTSYRPVMNAITSSPAVTWFELTLEYAPITDIRKLKILNEYVYNLVREKYMTRDNFRDMITEASIMNNLFNTLKSSFNRFKELYFVSGLLNADVYPLHKNYELYEFLSDNPYYIKYFSNAFRPFGVKTRMSLNTECIDSNESGIECPPIVPTTDTIQSYSGSINIYDIVELIKQWKW
jgi:hypothetical protein